MGTELLLAQVEETKKCSKCKRELPVDCFYNHKIERDEKHSQCKECMNVVVREWTENGGKEWQKNYKKQYYASEKGKKITLQCGSRYRNSLKGQKRRQEWWKEYYQKPGVKERTAKRGKEWGQTVKGKISARNSEAKRRERVKNGTVLTQNLLDLYNNAIKCPLCKKKFNLSRVKVIDHVIPLLKGGEHILSNLQILCTSCNAHKSSKIMYLI